MISTEHPTTTIYLSNQKMSEQQPIHTHATTDQLIFIIIIFNIHLHYIYLAD
jgi:hypothetical protein